MASRSLLSTVKFVFRQITGCGLIAFNVGIISVELTCFMGTCFLVCINLLYGDLAYVDLLCGDLVYVDLLCGDLLSCVY